MSGFVSAEECLADLKGLIQYAGSFNSEQKFEPVPTTKQPVKKIIEPISNYKVTSQKNKISVVEFTQLHYGIHNLVFKVR